MTNLFVIPGEMAPFCVSVSLFLRLSLNHLPSWSLAPRVWPSLTLSTSCKVNVPPGSLRAPLFRASSAQASTKCPYFVHQPYVSEEFFGSIQSVYMHHSHNLSIREVPITQLQAKLKKTKTKTTATPKHWAALLSGNSDAKSLEGGHRNVSDSKAWASR